VEITKSCAFFIDILLVRCCTLFLKVFLLLQIVYFLIFVVTLLIGVVKAFLFVYALIGASSRLHNAVFKVVFASPMSFFDSTPTGRILNRCLAWLLLDKKNKLVKLAKNSFD